MKYKRKKNTRQRAGTTHGWGSMKKHRGAGNRGGRGRAGSGKRGDSKKPCNWKEKHYGKFGFKKKNKVALKSINLRTLENMLNSLLEKKLVTEENGIYSIDLNKLGYDKLLASGKITKKFKITALYSSGNAVEKVKKAGGEITVLNQPAEQNPEEV